MTRARAASIHLGLSVIIGSVLLVACLLVWYPEPLFRAVGGQRVFLVLLGTDVMLGPLLTLIVFDSTKKSLKFDLVAIALAQMIALVYGVFTLLIGRPVYVAALGHRFDLVQANDVDPERRDPREYTVPWSGPKWVGTAMPRDENERRRLILMASGETDLGHFPQYHQPLTNMRDELLKNASPVSSLAKFNPGKDAAIQRWLADHGRSMDNTVFQGLKARAEDMAVIMDGKTAEVIGIAPFKPWD